MDIRGWKRVIFAWVKKCGFVDENVLTLEQSDINIFFHRYLEYDDMEIPLDMDSTRHAKPLYKFIKVVYPNFYISMDRSGNLNRVDYVMAYTLMLHYACVIKKSEKYQHKCTELSEPMQRAIASFLKRVVHNEKITRECLREALKDTRMNSPSTVGRAPNSPGTPVTPDTASPQTPTETPSHTSGHSPLPICSTPMRERGRITEAEWRQVRERLTTTEIKLAETENKLAETETKLTSTEQILCTTTAEYTILDDLVQELGQKETKVRNENKELVAEIGLLKEKVRIFEEHANDEDAEGQNYYEHSKLCYLKDLAAKDKEIAEARESMQDAINECAKENTRVRVLEEQLKICFDQISQLDLKVKEQTENLMKKDAVITCLERDKQDLTQCLNVQRQESQGRREVLNASSDMLDTSLSPGSMPENLASAVIEKQLREKDQEICQMKENSETLRTNICQMLKLKVNLEQDQSQLLKDISDAIFAGRQMDTKNQSEKLLKELKALRAKLNREKATMEQMQQLHDREYTKVQGENLNKEHIVLEKQWSRINGAETMLEILASAKETDPEVAEQDLKQLEELHNQLEILENELSMMTITKLNTLHDTLNSVEDHRAELEKALAQNVEKLEKLEVAHEQLSKEYLEASKRHKQELDAKDAHELEPNELETKCNIVMLKRIKEEAVASEHAEKLADMLRRSDQIERRTATQDDATAQHMQMQMQMQNCMRKM
ncbi:myosin-13 isoform X2 [Drosophila obscura]|uniref:myosin-13 isoform X2 n=1 Tax=Drosophila obscura TaxID=7282 RepID=UPI001BB13403|nr:myosin-13 isoform X2 [Drosophila obscura]